MSDKVSYKRLWKLLIDNDIKTGFYTAEEKHI